MKKKVTEVYNVVARFHFNKFERFVKGLIYAFAFPECSWVDGGGEDVKN